MAGETTLSELIRGMAPKLNKGAYVFCSVKDISKIGRNDTLLEFKETEGITVVIEKNKADALHLRYNFVASWITLTVHSALEAVGLTAMFAAALAKNNISCNVVAGYYHDHIFVNQKDGKKAMIVLTELSKSNV